MMSFRVNQFLNEGLRLFKDADAALTPRDLEVFDAIRRERAGPGKPAPARRVHADGQQMPSNNHRN